MQRVLGSSRDWPLHDTAATRLIEHGAHAVRPAHALMQRAGEAVARLALAIAPHARRRLVYAGPGNNGGDGLEAAMRLQQAGHAVELALLAPPERLPEDAARSLQRAQDAGVRIHLGLPPQADHDAADLTIDALLGLGGTRAPAGALAEAVARLQSGCVLAIDLPSGLCADSGRALGDALVRARHTLSLLTLKPGLFTAQGRDAAGEVWFDTLGVAAPADSAVAWLAGAGSALEQRDTRHASHKGSFGDALVVGGAPGMSGAALLAARSALAAGAGRVYLVPLDPALAWPDVQRPELMLRAIESMDEAAWARSVVAAGCGGADAFGRHLERLVLHAGRLVLDADALNALAADRTTQSLVSGRAARGLPTVLTPHPLEAARLLGSVTKAVQDDRLGAARELATRYQSVVVLKGSGTIIAAPGRLPQVNTTGNAALATAGTGDVLAGWIAGRWAAAGDPSLHGPGSIFDLPFDVARAAVYRHGKAAEGSVAPLRAASLIERMHALG